MWAIEGRDTGTAKRERDITMCTGCGTGPEIELIVATDEIASGAGITPTLYSVVAK